MVDKILQKFDFSNPNDSPECLLLLLVVWLTVVGCVIWSIILQRYTKKWKFIWFVIVTFIPLGGVLAYLVRCCIDVFRKGEQYPFIGFWRNPK